MAKRYITRVIVTRSTHKHLEALMTANGMTKVAVLSKVVQWFADQPESIQAAILGRYPGAIQDDIHRAILTRMAEGVH